MMSMPSRSGLPTLGLDEFPGYFADLWSREGSAPVEPFPWQLELLQAAFEQRRWPDVVDLPTGSGKTSLIDLAVFMLALGAEEPPTQQWHPRRIALVVDRRVIVDQAADRAGYIAKRIADADGGVLKRVGDRLRSLAPAPDGSLPDRPLRSSVLRGGIVRDESWAHRPDIPAVIASTVDQVGSRMLMRGYGVSRGMRPIHAGLLGEDVLYLLDEVHLARPYAETLDAVRRYRRLGGRASALPDRWQVTQLSATVEGTDGWTFPGRPLDPGSHPVLARRLSAPKPAVLTEVAAPADPARARQKIADVCAQRANALVSSGARTTAVIVNRVDTARRAYESLQAVAKEVDVRLITGRMRPIDRDRVLAEIEPRVANGRVRAETDRPLILVATQSIEAGADFDLDAVVSECASLDALRQRFGRVDRDGMLGEAGTTYQSVIVAASRDVADGPADPVYGEALRKTWRWLLSLPSVDFGIQQLRPPDSTEELRALLPPQRHAPLLLPSHLDRWVRTSQTKVEADPEVAQWLHGIEASNGATDVNVVWREDIDEDLLAAATSSSSSGPHRGDQQRVQADDQARDRIAARVREQLEGRLDACPPQPEEALSVPLASVRAWLTADIDELVLADIWVNEAGDAGGRGSRRPPKNVLCWRDSRAQVVDIAGIAPGETIVVPATSGGITGGTWNPSSTESVSDVADEAYAKRELLVLRLSRPLDARLQSAVRAAYLAESPEGLMESFDEVGPGLDFPDPAVLQEAPSDERPGFVRAYLRGVVGHVGDDNAAAVVRTMTGLLGSLSWQPQPYLECLIDGRESWSYVVEAKRPARSSDAASPYDGTAEDDGRDGPSFADGAGASLITLSDHLDGVRRWAACLATNLGLPQELVTGLGLAGQLHDLGKLDGRFQLWLHGGNELACASASSPLAKSTSVSDQATRQAARSRSGYPSGQRHELLSLSLGSPAASGSEAELVRHLVATHHGQGRYRFEAQSDLPEHDVCFELGNQMISGTTAHALEQLDSGTVERFWSLSREWGWHGLVWLEAILRLADHQDSRSPGVAAKARTSNE